MSSLYILDISPLLNKVKLKVAHLCLTLCDPLDCSPPGSSVHEVFQARVLEWAAISFSRGSPNPGTEPASPMSPALQADSLPSEPSGKPFTMYTNDVYNLIHIIINQMMIDLICIYQITTMHTLNV